MYEDKSTSVYIMCRKYGKGFKIGYSISPENRATDLNDEMKECGVLDEHLEVIYSKVFSCTGAARKAEKVLHKHYLQYQENYQVKFGGYTEFFTAELPLVCVYALLDGQPDYSDQDNCLLTEGEGSVVDYGGFSGIHKYKGLRVLPSDKLMYLHLKTKGVVGEGLPVSTRVLCKELGVGSRVTINKYLKHLEDLGFISVHREKGKPNIYIRLPLLKKHITYL